MTRARRFSPWLIPESQRHFTYETGTQSYEPVTSFADAPLSRCQLQSRAHEVEVVVAENRKVNLDSTLLRSMSLAC